MNVRAITQFRAKLAADEPVHGVWITMEAPSLSEAAVAMGIDYLVIDAEHGHLDWNEIAAHLRTAVRSGTVVLVRIAEDNVGLIKRALDCGADGVVVPRVETAAQLGQIVALASFPPRGIRGIGAERATAWGQCFSEHVHEAATHTLVVPLVETVEGARNLPEMLAVPGVELFHFGPADHSASAGFPGRWEGPGVAQEILAGLALVRQAGKHAGIATRGKADLALRRGQGFRLLGLGMDVGLYLHAIRELLAAAGVDARLQPSFEPLDIKRLLEQSKQHALASLPAFFRPDREEAVCLPGQGPAFGLAAGATMDCLVGAHNQARQLTTGIVTLEPGAVLPYHTHRCGESVTVLEGSVLFEAQGRRYLLAPLDNITVPAGIAHQVKNTTPIPARVHAALASAAPDRQLVKESFVEQTMPENASGMAGAEHVVRIKTAKRYAAGPNTEFVDHLNSNLLPGIEMSGGYALFHPGGRLPAHLHDFDESICIVQGTATCNVEGRRYRMTDRATALQPRGRIHYFSNESPEPMAMIWVYAGPLPERLLIAEAWTGPGADPWQEK